MSMGVPDDELAGVELQDTAPYALLHHRRSGREPAVRYLWRRDGPHPAPLRHRGYEDQSGRSVSSGLRRAGLDPLLQLAQPALTLISRRKGCRSLKIPAEHASTCMKLE